MEPTEFLNSAYDKTMKCVGSNDSIVSDLDSTVSENLDIIISKSESSKGVFAVVLTSLIYKSLFPEQDIRNHQAGIENGYSGRSFDSRYITPFLKKNKFPAMAESGWLTRSLEQKSPYSSDYPGAIRPAALKTAFLKAIHFIEQGRNLDLFLSYLLQGMIMQRNRQQINLAKPVNLPIATIIQLLDKHFNSKYSADGASRLPVLALYAAYQCLILEAKRFEGKSLLEIESHTSADSKSGRIGDIDIVDKKGKSFEAVEVKHGIPITAQLVKDAFEKFKISQVKRYYLLSTAGVSNAESENVEKEIDRIRNIDGCHVIANGLIPSLTYYLRLLSETSEFIENYVILVESDNALKYEHKKQWNDIISDM